MNQIAIDDEAYKYLKLGRAIDGRDWSPFLMGMFNFCLGKDFFTLASSPPTAAPPVHSPKDKALMDFVTSPAYLANRNIVGLFLAILSFVYKQDSTAFGALDGRSGRTRIYIAKDRSTLESSGESVNAKQIPNSPFWVVTNNSTPMKKTLLGQALQLLGYHSAAIGKATDSLR
jgi:negative modulator of initiation of replication